MQERAFATTKSNSPGTARFVRFSVRGRVVSKGLILSDVASGEERTFPCNGFFVAIGHRPNTELFDGKLETDDVGYLRVKHPSTKTNIEGVFAAGDVMDPIYRQAVTAAGTGCQAAIDAERWLEAHQEE